MIPPSPSSVVLGLFVLFTDLLVSKGGSRLSGVLQPLTLRLYSHPWVFGSRSLPALEFCLPEVSRARQLHNIPFPVETDSSSPSPLADSLQECPVLL